MYLSSLSALNILYNLDHNLQGGVFFSPNLGYFKVSISHTFLDGHH
jgi:hypothetical protein